MIKNASLAEIGRMMLDADTILLFPHVSPDGDALGSCAAAIWTKRRATRTMW